MNVSELTISVRRWLLHHGLPQCREGQLIYTWRPVQIAQPQRRSVPATHASSGLVFCLSQEL